MNQPLNPVLEKVVRILLDKGPDAAAAFIGENLTPDVEAARLALEQAQSIEGAAKNIVALMRTGGHTPAVPTVTGTPRFYGGGELVPMSPLAQVGLAAVDERRNIVLEVANDLILAHEAISTEDVVQMAAQRGKPILGGRPGTSVGNILFRHPDWVRLEDGRFKRKDA